MGAGIDENAARRSAARAALSLRAFTGSGELLIACIDEVFPLPCLIFGDQMRVIASITDSADLVRIKEHIGVPSAPPSMALARGPTLWGGSDVPSDEAAQAPPEFDAWTRVPRMIINNFGGPYPRGPRGVPFLL